MDHRRTRPQQQHHRGLRALVLLVLALVATDAWAVVLYKLTDAQGQVTYTDAVPRGFRGDVERLEVDTTRTATPGPLEAQTPAEALAEYERIIARRPAASAREARVESARARLEAARSALDLARTNSRAEDWIYFGPNNPLGMRRAPRPEYQARLQQLEAEVRLAEDALRAAEAG